jgi:proline dehydrogenase
MLKQLLVKTLPYVPRAVVRTVASRYIAGETLADAVKTVKNLNSLGATATVDVLGEFVSSRDQVVREMDLARRLVDALGAENLRSGMSVKLTSLGLDIDEEFCYQNVRSLVERARAIGRFVRIDMENTPYTGKTLALYRRLREEGFDNTGVVIQAYLRRSEDDIEKLSLLNASVRLCKGIYKESERDAFQGREEVQDNYKKLLDLLFDREMFAAIATHDDVLIDYALEQIARRGISKEKYEFQMLLGVREQKRNEIIRLGHPLRIYVPFGKDWYGYSLRRMKENPDIAKHVFKAVLGLES